MAEHPHAARIQAAAHLSAALAMCDCALEALAEDGIVHADSYVNDARALLRDAADEILEPCAASNVLATVEEVIAIGRSGAFGPPHEDYDRAKIVLAIVDARQDARADEVVA